MDNQKQTVAQTVKEANNILITVSANPSVDQLAACIGLTLALNKLGKHATAVFSGAVPSTIEFLQPEKTIEKNTDSLRDFIIALDKSKADKLRYKLEDRVVKIFITPYKTSINEKDLEFSQGDFNVDVVLALGVHQQADLDQAITSHGRILHDAKVITVNFAPGGELGTINWLDTTASSLSELATQLVDVLDKKLIDSQIATALLTGIVAETERFSNSRTTPQTMSASAELMAAGANQQLVASKLEEPAPPPPAPIADIEPHDETPVPPKSDDGTLEIAHEESSSPTPMPEQPEPTDQPQPGAPVPAEGEHVEPPKEEPEPPKDVSEPAPGQQAEPEDAPQIHIDEHGQMQPESEEEPTLPEPQHEEMQHNDRPYLGNPSHRTDDDSHTLLGVPPSSAPMSSNVMPDGFVASGDPLSLPDLDMPLLDRQPLHREALTTPSVAPTIMPPGEDGKKNDQPPSDKPAEEPATDQPAGSPQPPATPPTDVTLTQIEKEVNSPHLSSLTPYETLDSEPPKANEMPAETPAAPASDQPSEPPATPPANDTAAPQTDTTSPNPAADDAASEATDKPAGEQLPDAPTVEDARSAVEKAINSMGTQPLEPIKALGAQELGSPNGGSTAAPATPSTSAPATPSADDPIKGATGITLVQPDDLTHIGPASENSQPPAPDQPLSPNPPPPSPPPMLPPLPPSQ